MNPSRLGIDVVLLLMVLSAIIFGFFFILKKYIIPFLDSRKAIKKAKRTVFRMEVVTWFAFVLFALTRLMRESYIVTIVLLAVVAVVALNFWIDFFAGIRFKFEDKFKENDLIRFDTYSGTIEKISTTSIQIKTEDEELVFINYRKIIRGTLIKQQAKGKLISSKLLLNIGTLSEELVVARVIEWIYQSPWAVPGSKNSVLIQPGGLLSATIYAVDSDSLGKVERMLKNKINELHNTESDTLPLKK